MSRFDDDLHLVSPQGFVPQTVAALLKRVGLSDAPHAQQSSAIGDWLAIHQPTAMMQLSLRESGFGYLLDRSSAI